VTGTWHLTLGMLNRSTRLILLFQVQMTDQELKVTCSLRVNLRLR